MRKQHGDIFEAVDQWPGHNWAIRSAAHVAYAQSCWRELTLTGNKTGNFSCRLNRTSCGGTTCDLGCVLVISPMSVTCLPTGVGLAHPAQAIRYYFCYWSSRLHCQDPGCIGHKVPASFHQFHSCSRRAAFIAVVSRLQHKADYTQCIFNPSVHNLRC